MGKTFILTIDLEEFERAQGVDRFEISKRGLDSLADLLTVTNVPATFFTTDSFAWKYLDEVRSLSEKHEIALHALDHSDNYSEMEPEEAKKKLTMAKNALERITGKPVTGFRAPQMQAPGMDVLESIGIRYDSSLHPTYVPGRYSNRGETMQIHRKDAVVRVPVSVTPRLRIPYSWFWFRVAGVWYAKMCTKATAKQMEFVTVYFHPWDFTDLRKVNGIGRIYARNTHRSIGMLERYLEWLKGKGYTFSTMGDYLKENGLME